MIFKPQLKVAERGGWSIANTIDYRSRVGIAQRMIDK
jgi:hypothetical protein